MIHSFTSLPITDCHVHFVHPERMEEMLALMDAVPCTRFNLVCIPNPDATTHNPAALYFKEHHPERVYISGALDYTVLANLDHASDLLAAQIVALKARGFDGVKLIEGKPQVRKLLPHRLDGPLYSGMWESAERENFPVVFHVNDPDEFWDPEKCPDWARESGWDYSDGSFPSKEDLYGEVENILARHPGLKIIFAHFYFLSQNLDRAARFLDAHPSVLFDLAPHIGMYVDLSVNPEVVRQFFLRYQSRIVFGTDTDTRAMVENRRDFTKGIPILIRSFLEWDAPFGKPGGPKYHGLGLPRDVLEKIYHLNFETNFGNNPARLPTSSVKGGFSVNSVHPPTPVAIAQQLIRFNTTNPPGNEWECITFSRDLLQDAGIPTQMSARSTQRPNLIARLPGRGESSPLLLFGHVDVVPANDQDWIHPPFQAKIADGYLWGRGALDMKGGVAMMLSAILRAKGEGMQPPGDILLVLVSDEEAGGDDGAGFLVNEHPELFHEVRYAIGEFGGFSLPIAGKRFYPIQVAEKQVCWVKCILRGKGGHGSMPVRDGAMDGLADLLHSVTRKRLPVHITPPARQMFESIAAGLGGIKGLLFHLLLVPGLTNPVLDLLGERSWAFDPLLHHTLSPTVVKGSSKINVIPEQVSIELDGRLLPGFQPEDLLSELRHICKPQVEFELIRHEPGPPKVDMSLFKVLAEILRESDPQGIPIPFLLSGFTDARHFSRLGIQSYGFLPMRLPDDFDFSNTIHAADERIPVEALEFGTTALLKAILRYG